MRILHIAPSIAQTYGGPTQSLAGYITASRRSGSEVHVAAPHASTIETGALASAGAAQVMTFRSVGRGAFTSSPSLVRWVRRNSRSYDVVHVHGLFNPISTLSSRAVVTAGVPLVLRPFGTLSRYTFTHRRGALKRAYFALLERRNVMNASVLHFTTAAERDEAAWHGLPIEERACVVPPPWVGSTHASVGRNHTGNVILFLGRLHPVKNLEALIEAWPAVSQVLPDARLVIAGAGDPRYAARLRDLAGRLGLSKSVTFTGFLSGALKADAFATAAVFVLPSHHENFGIAVLEAVAAGLPVVMSRNVQLRDFIAENQLGIVTVSSAPALAQALVGALSNETLRRRVAIEGPALVAATYGPDAIGARLSAMYLAAVANRHQ